MERGIYMLYYAVTIKLIFAKVSYNLRVSCAISCRTVGFHAVEHSQFVLFFIQSIVSSYAYLQHLSLFSDRMPNCFL